MTKSRLLFLGTPEFANPALRVLARDSKFEVVGVLTQPDKPAGRGLEVTPSPVSVEASALGLPIFKPRSLKSFGETTTDPELERVAVHLKQFPAIDAAIVVAYGKIIPKILLDFPRCGVVNIHPSLLPRWRGAAPIQHAIFSGDTTTGVCLMRLDEGLDTGPVYRTEEVEISSGESCGDLTKRLSEIGAQLLQQTLPSILDGSLGAVPQSDTGATYAEKWDKEDARIQWNETAHRALCRIRASQPEPGARAQFKGEMVKILSAKVVKRPAGVSDETPGVVVESNRVELIVAAGEGSFMSLLELQFPGRKQLPIAEILKGKKIVVGDRFE